MLLCCLYFCVLKFNIKIIRVNIIVLFFYLFNNYKDDWSKLCEISCFKRFESYKRDKNVKIMNVYFNGILLRIVFYF